MSGAAVGLIFVIACAAYFVITRGKRTHATGAFRNSPSGDERSDDAGGDGGGDGGGNGE